MVLFNMTTLHATALLRRLEAADELAIPFWLQMEAQRHSNLFTGHPGLLKTPIGMRQGLVFTMETCPRNAPRTNRMDKETRNPARRRTVDVFFKPRNVAVIGATEAPHSVGRSIVANLRDAPFPGRYLPGESSARHAAGSALFPQHLKRSRGGGSGGDRYPSQALFRA